MGGRRHPEQTLTCPSCGTRNHEVVDTRYGAGSIRRRRLCTGGHYFTTTETVDAGGILPSATNGT